MIKITLAGRPKRFLRRTLRETRRKAKNFLIKSACFVCAAGLMAEAAMLDSFTTWKPFALMALQAAFLLLCGYANGVFRQDR